MLFIWRRKEFYSKNVFISRDRPCFVWLHHWEWQLWETYVFFWVWPNNDRWFNYRFLQHYTRWLLITLLLLFGEALYIQYFKTASLLHWKGIPSYLFAIGLPSAISASRESGGNSPEGFATYDHSYYWAETRANKNAADYFGKYYGVNWNNDKYLYKSKLRTLADGYPQ